MSQNTLRSLVLRNAQITTLIESGFLTHSLFSELSIPADIDRIKHILRANAFLMSKMKYLCIEINEEDTSLFNTHIYSDMDSVSIEINIGVICFSLKASNFIELAVTSMEQSSHLIPYKINTPLAEGILYSKESIDVIESTIKSVPDFVKMGGSPLILKIVDDIIRGVKYDTVRANYGNTPEFELIVKSFNSDGQKSRPFNTMISKKNLVSVISRYWMTRIASVNPHFKCGDTKFRAASTRKNPEHLRMIIHTMQSYI